jgi:hypothetical protein
MNNIENELQSLENENKEIQADIAQCIEGRKQRANKISNLNLNLQVQMTENSKLREDLQELKRVVDNFRQTE